MTPLPRDNGDRRANTQKLIFDYSFVNSTHFSVKDVQFSIKLPMWPKGCPKRAKGAPRAGQRTPKAAQRRPKDAQREPRGRQRRSKDTQGVCVTHVILTPGACGGGVRAAVPDTTLSGKFSGVSGKFSGNFCAQAAEIVHAGRLWSQGVVGQILGRVGQILGHPNGSQGEPKGIPKGAKGSPKSGQRRPKAAQKAQLYKQTPDQPPKRPLCYVYVLRKT